MSHLKRCYLKPFRFESSDDELDDEVPQQMLDITSPESSGSSSSESSDSDSSSDSEVAADEIGADDGEAEGPLTDEDAPAVDDDSLPVQLETERGRSKISYEGHVYVSPKTLSDGVRVAWRCQFKLKCKCRLHTAGMRGAVVSMIGAHNHLGDPACSGVHKFKNLIKGKARTSFDSPMGIMGAAVETVDVHVQQQGPTKDAVRMLIYRERKKVIDAPVNPVSRAEIQVPENFATYVTGDKREDFLLLDSGLGDSDRILVFGRRPSEEDTTAISALYADGTFKVTPPLFDQLFVITARRGTFVQPLFYVLLPHRDQKTYDRMFAMIQQEFPRLQPAAIYVDFEMALISACLKAFPEARLNGCFFHLCQALHRHLKHGLKKLYETDVSINLQVKMIVALAFVPPVHIRRYLSALRQRLDRRLQKLLAYFKKTYVGQRERVQKRVRNATVVIYRDKAPRYSVKMWSQYERLQNGDDSTNNYSEGAHTRCRRHLNVEHPALWRFITALHGLQRVLDFDYHRYLAGDVAGKSKKNAVEQRNARLRVLIEEMETRTEWEFLKGVAANLQL